MRKYLLHLSLSFIFAVPLLLIWGLVYTAPFGSPVHKVVPLLTVIPVVLVAVSQSVVVFLVSLLKRSMIGILLLSVYALGSFLFVFLVGLGVHQDFFSAVFMLLVQLIILVLYRYDLFFPSLMVSDNRLPVFSFGLVSSVLFFLWIILMGYALCTRQEPRWWESLIYNVYNTFLAAILLVATLRLLRTSPRKVSVGKTLFRVDGLDFSSVIGHGSCNLAWNLLTKGPTVTCSQIAQRETPNLCQSCQDAKVRHCPTYRSLYNNMRMVRQIFEALRLGTVTGPDERRKVLHVGWRFVKSTSILIQDLEECEGKMDGAFP